MTADVADVVVATEAAVLLDAGVSPSDAGVSPFDAGVPPIDAPPSFDAPGPARDVAIDDRGVPLPDGPRPADAPRVMASAVTGLWRAVRYQVPDFMRGEVVLTDRDSTVPLPDGGAGTPFRINGLLSLQETRLDDGWSAMPERAQIPCLRVAHRILGHGHALRRELVHYAHLLDRQRERTADLPHDDLPF